MFKKLIKGTLLSILIFFSISFLTVLFQINSPLNRIEGTYELKIGFPFEYYHEFMVDCLIPNSGWNTRNLILNCGLTWGITMLLIMSKNREK
jgi:hypothetical protein